MILVVVYELAVLEWSKNHIIFIFKRSFWWCLSSNLECHLAPENFNHNQSKSKVSLKTGLWVYYTLCVLYPSNFCTIARFLKGLRRRLLSLMSRFLRLDKGQNVELYQDQHNQDPFLIFDDTDKACHLAIPYISVKHLRTELWQGST